MRVEPYSALAIGYDVVMDHVDYDAWAVYVHTLLQNHGTTIRDVVELGGGTGSLAIRLQPLGGYQYTLTDKSGPMLEEARKKVDAMDVSVRCAQADFTEVTLEDLDLSNPTDGVVLLYDGLNYLLEAAAVETLFRRVHDLLRPGGIAVIDQTTPINSETEDFVDEGTDGDFAYVRENHYDPETCRHETIFTLTIDGTSVTERHVQRAYTLNEVRGRLDASPLAVEAAYDNFTMDPAHSESPRIHWVLRRPADSS